MTDQLNIPFTKESTADDVIAGVDLTGKRAIVTGASSGLGAETARALACAGADVTLAVRNLDAGRQVAAGITAKTGNASVHARKLDLDDRACIDAFVAAWEGPLHILVDNAGIMALPELTRTLQSCCLGGRSGAGSGPSIDPLRLARSGETKVPQSATSETMAVTSN
ncbi:SDR family NAD(P)-dependent oxidoreductase [Nonomuraea sp. NPDC003201]